MNMHGDGNHSIRITSNKATVWSMRSAVVPLYAVTPCVALPQHLMDAGKNSNEGSINSFQYHIQFVYHMLLTTDTSMFLIRVIQLVQIYLNCCA